jgi:hypothetical protein
MLREIDPIICRQFVSSTHPALVLTVVQLCFLPPFKYIVIKHDIDTIVYISQPYNKEQVENIYNIKLDNNDRSAIQRAASMVQLEFKQENIS